MSIENTMRTDAAQAPGTIDDIDSDVSPDDEAMAPFENVGKVVMYGALIWGGIALAAAATWYCLRAQPAADKQPDDEPASVYHAR